MKTTFTILFALISLIAKSQTLFIAQDVTIQPSINYQIRVLLHEAMAEGYAELSSDAKKHITMGTDPIPPLIVNCDLDTVIVTSFKSLRLENTTLKDNFLSVVQNVQMYVVLEEQFVRWNTIRIPDHKVSEWTKEKRIAFANEILPFISYDGKSYYWKDKKLAALLIMN